MNDETQTQTAALKTLNQATVKAKAKLGAAWDSMPCLRDGAVAVEILAIMAAKDADTTTAARLIRTASEFTAQTVV